MPCFKLQAEALANSLKWNLRKSSTFVSHILFHPIFSLFFHNRKIPELCSVPEHPPFYLIILEDEKLFHSTPTKSVIASTTQPRSTLSPTQCLRLWLSSSTSCVSFLGAHTCLYTFPLLNTGLTVTCPVTTHISLNPSQCVGELFLLHQHI